ncbi:MAG TPA: Abi family protein [Bacilli bacterium]|nr:Abi family protein [Bacilli bacterium]
MTGCIKEFKTIEQQVDILREKGLKITDEEKTKDILLRENYFFINGYRFMFFKSDKDRRFIEGTTFEELYGLFVFDRNIRNILFKNLLIVENNVKSIFSYQLSKKYGYKEKDYLKLENFTSDISKSRQVSDVINKMKRQIRVNGKKHSATLHYLTNYGYIPMWILVKVLSFGIISELYNILKYEDQRDISSFYKISEIDMAVFLPLMSNYRNLCAHEDMLYNHKTQRAIPNNKYHEQLNIEKVDEEYKYGKNDLYALVMMLKYMLREEEFRLLIYELGYEIDLLDEKINSVPLTKILEDLGFPSNWKDIAEM